MIYLTLDPEDLLDSEVLADVKALALVHAGEHRLTICHGDRVLTLGYRWTMDASGDAIAGLEELGTVEVHAVGAPEG